MPFQEPLVFPESWTQEMKDIASELGWTQEDVNEEEAKILLLPGCTPSPDNCGACNESGCMSLFRIEMNADANNNPPTGEN